jgi:hypothetical protein
MIDSIEEFFQIKINHPAVALRKVLLRLCHGLMVTGMSSHVGRNQLARA